MSKDFEALGRLVRMCRLLVKRPEYVRPDGTTGKANSVFDSRRREFYKLTKTT